MTHHFATEVADVVGVNSAIILTNFHFWISYNKAMDKHCHKGVYWTYGSRNSLAELFSYFTANQVRTAIDKLVKEGLVITDNFNKTPYDKTNWFTITQRGYALLGEDIHSGTFTPVNGGKNPYERGEKNPPILDNKKDNKNISLTHLGVAQIGETDLTGKSSTVEKRESTIEDDETNATAELGDLTNDSSICNVDVSSKKMQLEANFDKLWKLYPRKKGKASVSKKTKEKLLALGYDNVVRAIEAYANECLVNGTQEQFIQHGSTFFNSGLYDYIDENTEKGEQDVATDRLGEHTRNFKDF